MAKLSNDLTVDLVVGVGRGAVAVLVCTVLIALASLSVAVVAIRIDPCVCVTNDAHDLRAGPPGEILRRQKGDGLGVGAGIYQHGIVHDD